MQADAYAGFNRLYEAGRKPGAIVEAVCWAHYLEHIFMWSGCVLTGFLAPGAHHISGADSA